MKVYTLQEVRALSLEVSDAWMQLMHEMDSLHPEGGQIILRRYNWDHVLEFMAAQSLVLQLKACKEANEAIQVLGEHFIDEMLA